MTEIAFHHGVPEPLDYCARLLRKAYNKGSTVTVLGEAHELAALSKKIWCLGECDFIAHALVLNAAAGSATPTLAATDAAQNQDFTNNLASYEKYSRLLLCDDITRSAQHQILLHLLPTVSSGFERFAQLIEVVGVDTSQRAQARERLKYYKSRGYEVRYHAYTGAAAAPSVTV